MYIDVALCVLKRVVCYTFKRRIMTEKDNIVRVFSGSTVEANYVRQQLEDKGIKVLLKDDYSTGFITSSLDEVDLFVEESNASNALDLIKKLKA